MHKYVDSHLPLSGIYALSPFLFIYFFFNCQEKYSKNLAAKRGKGGIKTRLKNHFSHCSFSIKKKKEEEEEEEEEEESKKERKKEKKRKEKKKEKKRKEERKKERSIALFLTKVRETKPFFVA